MNEWPTTNMYQVLFVGSLGQLERMLLYLPKAQSDEQHRFVGSLLTHVDLLRERGEE